MAIPAKVSKSALTFEPDVFKKNTFFTIASNSTPNTMVSLVLLVIAHTARIVCGYTHTQDNYCNPRCACTSRVKYRHDYLLTLKWDTPMMWVCPDQPSQ